MNRSCDFAQPQLHRCNLSPKIPLQASRMAAMASRSRTCKYSLRYWAADHPFVVKFRWDHSTWGGSWTFLVASVPLYLFLIFFIKLLFCCRKRPIPLGLIPALHNLILLLASIAMFVGCWQAAVVEIQESCWLWRSRNRKALDWLLCFPLGTRPVGRVFFWSYIYYLSKFYALFDTVIIVLRRKRLTVLHVFHQATVIIMSFCWLQFTQSLQILTILTNTGVHAILYFYFFLVSVGFSPSWKKFVTDCQIVQSVFSLLASIGCLRLHFRAGGCAGMGAWIFNSFFNITLLLLFVNFYCRQYGKVNTKRPAMAIGSNKKSD